MAHPFAGRNFAFSVMSEETLWWGGCAWDAFAIPHLLQRGPMLVATTCPACGTTHAWNVGPDGPPAGDQVAHFLVPMRSVWDDVVEACRNQRVFCSTDCVSTWLQRHRLPMGSTFSLATLWRLASHWYDGRLAPSYTRRDPQEAGAYFAEVGLTGEFWTGSGTGNTTEP
nr:organomercurial lyase [Kineococcus aurantiacus]